jgi:hypothetical protein
MQKVAKTGLCSTCNHNEKCIQANRNGRVINHCEEFDGYAAPARIKPARKPLAQRFISPNGYMGLCVNCEKRETCMNAHSEGGIWHCEEYK